MSDIQDILERTEKITRQEMRSETAGGGRSTEYAKFRKLALRLDPGGDAAKIPELTESEVSSIRTQVNHLNDEDAEEKEFVATRRKMKTKAGEDREDGEGNQLYNLYIYRNEVEEDTNTDQPETASDDTSGSEETGQEGDKSEAQADFEELFGE